MYVLFRVFRCRSRSDSGQASLAVVLLLVACTTFALLSVAVAEVLIDRAQAQTAADAAALVGVVEGREAARTYAQLNGANLIDFAAHGTRVSVTVRRGRVQATAVAERRTRLVWPGEP